MHKIDTLLSKFNVWYNLINCPELEIRFFVKVTWPRSDNVTNN